MRLPAYSDFFFFNDTATTEIYTLSLHDALPIFREHVALSGKVPQVSVICGPSAGGGSYSPALTDFVVMTEQARMFLRSEEHTSELQSRQYLVCRLLLEKKKHIQSTRGRSPAHIV